MGPSPLEPCFTIFPLSASVFNLQQFYSQVSSLKPTNTFSLSHLSDGLPPNPSHLQGQIVVYSHYFHFLSISYHIHLAYYHLVSELTDAALTKPPIASGLPKPRCAF